MKLKLSLLLLGFCYGVCKADDWPMWRHDNGRTAASSLELPGALRLQWKRELPPPAPTFPGDLRLCFDKSYEPVVSGKRMFLPSMVTDSVAALDTDTGEELWRVFADGPVRFAPVAWENKVYFVSDDGFLYCVGAEDGRLLWKFSPMEPSRQAYKLLGDERLVSRWPARGGPVLADGTVYFAAGIWPFEGVAVCAVDANTGKARWVNTDCALVKDGLVDHGSRFDGGVAPQGYLTVLGSRLIVPCGRSLPAFFDRATGRMEPYTSGWGGRIALAKGNWYASAVGDWLFQAGDLYRIRSDITPPKPSDYIPLKEFARQMKVSDKTMEDWITQFKLNIVTRDGERWLRVRNSDEVTFLTWNTKRKSLSDRPGEQHALDARTRLQIDPTNAKELGVFREPVLTADAMYYSVATDDSIRSIRNGNEDRVQPKVFTYTGIVACDLTSQPEWQTSFLGGYGWSRATFKQLWSLPSSLKVHIKAGSRLYVSGPKTIAAVDTGSAKISWQTSIVGTPNRMLVADGKLFVITNEGTIYCFGAKKVWPKTFAVAAERPSSPRDRWSARAADILKRTGARDGYCVVLGLGTGRLVEELARQSSLRIIVLEPSSGNVPAARREFFRQGLYGSRVHIVPGDLKTLKLAPYLASLVVSEEDQSAEKVMTLLRPYGGAACFSTITRQGALLGSADWSHASGDAAHTFASQDQRIAAPLGVLWFGGGLDRTVPWIEGDPPKLPSEAECSGFAGAGPPPRVAGGRMFIQIGDELFASDIYTGRHLWKKTVKALDNFAATEDSVYAVAGRSCLRLDAATGKQLAAFRGDWREIRVRGDLLVGTTGKLLVCVDRRTGATLWKLESQRDEFGFAVGSDRVFGVDYWQLAHRQKDDPKTEEAEIIAVKLASGEVLWRTQATTPTTALPKPKSFAPPLKPQLAFSEASDALLFTRNQATAAAYRGATGQLLWSKELLIKDSPTSFSSYHPPIVLADRLITHSGRVFGLLSGEPWGLRMWKGANVDLRGCGRALGSPRLIVTRDAFASYFDLGTGVHTYLRGIRAGCTSSLIPANGIVVAPHYSRHCNCNYPLSFSSAFVTMPEAASWDLANAEKSQ